MMPVRTKTIRQWIASILCAGSIAITGLCSSTLADDPFHFVSETDPGAAKAGPPAPINDFSRNQPKSAATAQESPTPFPFPADATTTSSQPIAKTHRNDAAERLIEQSQKGQSLSLFPEESPNCKAIRCSKGAQPSNTQQVDHSTSQPDTLSAQNFAGYVPGPVLHKSPPSRFQPQPYQMIPTQYMYVQPYGAKSHTIPTTQPNTPVGMAQSTTWGYEAPVVQQHIPAIYKENLLAGAPPYGQTRLARHSGLFGGMFRDEHDVPLVEGHCAPADVGGNFHYPLPAEEVIGSHCVDGVACHDLGVAPHYHPFIASTAKPGDDLVTVDTNLFVPILQDCDWIFFAHLRGRMDDSDNYEAGAGIGIRELIDECKVFSLYAYYDYLTTEGENEFYRGVVGMEFLTVNWDLRANGYIPNPDSSNTTINAIFANGIGTSNGVERAAYGFDVETGLRLLALGENDWVELRAFVGTYYFDTSHDNYEEIFGVRGRLELRLYDFNCKWPGSRLTAGVEAQHDDVRDNQIWGMIRVRVPIGGERLGPLHRRLLDLPVRDVN